MSALPSPNTRIQSPLSTYTAPNPNHYHCLPLPWPLHVCPGALIIYSLTTARGDIIKHKTDHVTLLHKPLRFSGFLSEWNPKPCNGLQSFPTPPTPPPLPLPYAFCHSSSNLTLFQPHWPPGSCQEQCLLPQDLGTCCPSALSQLSTWHTSSLPWPFIKYGNHSLNKDNIRTYWLSRDIDDRDSKQRLS